MPVNKGKDTKGNFFRWGNQKKYYYIARNKESRYKAFIKAKTQGIAIRAQNNYL
jgi:hypothetical protein